MKTLFALLLISSAACFGADRYRIICPSCSATNVISPVMVQSTNTPVADTASETDRKQITVTKTFTCENCGNGIVSTSTFMTGKRIVDAKANENETLLWISSHPPPIKPPKLK